MTYERNGKRLQWGEETRTDKDEEKGTRNRRKTKQIPYITKTKQ